MANELAPDFCPHGIGPGACDSREQCSLLWSRGDRGTLIESVQRSPEARTWPEMPAWATEGDDDRPLPEDAAILAAFPTRSGRHDLYGEAMRLVGARRSKGGLVELVNWLLHRCEQRPETPKPVAWCPFCVTVNGAHASHCTYATPTPGAFEIGSAVRLVGKVGVIRGWTGASVVPGQRWADVTWPDGRWSTHHESSLERAGETGSNADG